MSFTKKQVQALAVQARLALTEEEINGFTVNLNNTLQFIKKIQEISLPELEPTTHGTTLTNIWREDQVSPSLRREDALANAPDQEDYCFRVPKIGEEG